MKTFKNLDDYVKAAVSTARFEKIEGGHKVYAELPGFQGVWAEGRTRQEAIRQLHEVLNGWIELQLERGCELPRVKGGRFEVLTYA